MALSGVSGSLVASDLLIGVSGTQKPSRIRGILRDAQSRLGPVSSAIQVFDVLASPLLGSLGVSLDIHSSAASAVLAAAPHMQVVTGPWGADLSRLRRSVVPAGTARWWIGVNGPSFRILDASRAYTRRALDFDLDAIGETDSALAILQALFAGAGSQGLPVLDRLIEESEHHRTAVSRSLREGVESALDALVRGFHASRRRVDPDIAFADALTVLYRILFLLFAEARGLVPQWHPTYRRHYTIESLRTAAESRQPIGLWQSLQAISRLAHRGCHAGTLRVVPFNGRLFSPSNAPLAESAALDDRVAGAALAAITTRPGRDRRDRISYADLGVEQLGAVYEHVLDRGPAADDTQVSARKRTGTFYTPRSMTEYLVRRTLAPLVRRRTPEMILALRVVDPAMGSGAFLVAACRYLAAAYETALLDEGTCVASDLTPADRSAFRRVIAQRCLYGVDINPTAVQLARLSLWLCTLAADKPLSFLDHHLRIGNSLAGASIEDVLRQPPGSGPRRAATLPLFDVTEFGTQMAHALGPRLRMAAQLDDAIEAVRDKERALAALDGADGPLARWRTLADAWCATWFWSGPFAAATPKTWPALSAACLGQSSGLPGALDRDWRSTVDAVARRERFFHWPLEFPEIFADADGTPRDAPGFDAVIGNPPWSAASRQLAGFSRESGCYRAQSGGHANLYQLFAERMTDLVRSGGRLGMLMPSGLLTDLGGADLRALLLRTFGIDAVIGFDNRAAIFPIHRGMRFSLITATAGGATPELPVRFGLSRPETLDNFPDEGRVAKAVSIPVEMLARFSGDSLAVPEFLTADDRAIVAGVLDRCPPVGSARGWEARFGRELNATEDSAAFGDRGLPIVEGKMIEPFKARIDAAAAFIDPAPHRALLTSRTRYQSARLAYREVASATNRLTLIAAVLPRGTVTTHTVFCLKAPIDEDLHWFLCGIFNSYIANYLVRLRGGTHVPASVIEWLPAPVVPRGSPAFTEFVDLVRAAAADPSALTRVQATAARLYGCDRDEVRHILATFPRVDDAAKSSILRVMASLGDAI